MAFEYDDFFFPDVLDDEEETKKRKELFLSRPLPKRSTFHGAFFDVTIFSSDKKIREVSDLRVTQSIEIARDLGARAVVFHTNYIANFSVESYRLDWLNKNEAYWREKLEKYPDIEIFIENMFDTDPVLLAQLGKRMENDEHFGVCFDYAHAAVSSVALSTWTEALAPYVKHVHINDNDLVHDLHLPLGTGSIDWDEFSVLYKEFLSGASVLIEHTGVDNQERSLKFLNKLI